MFEGKRNTILAKKNRVVFQDFQLLSDRTVKDNLSFVLRATGWVDNDKINNRVQEVLTQVVWGKRL